MLKSRTQKAESKPCPVPGCKLKERDHGLCSWHWLTLPVQLRNQIKLGIVNVSFAVVMHTESEAHDKRQEKIDDAVIR